MNNIFSDISTNEWYLFLLFFISITILILLSELSLRKKIWSTHANMIIIHITVGIAVSLTPHIFTTSLQPALLALIFFLINLISYKNKILNSFHSIGRVSYGTIFFPLSYLLMAIPFWDYPIHITISKGWRMVYYCCGRIRVWRRNSAKGFWLAINWNWWVGRNKKGQHGCRSNFYFSYCDGWFASI